MIDANLNKIIYIYVYVYINTIYTIQKRKWPRILHGCIRKHTTKHLIYIHIHMFIESLHTFKQIYIYVYLYIRLSVIYQVYCFFLFLYPEVSVFALKSWIQSKPVLYFQFKPCLTYVSFLMYIA